MRRLAGPAGSLVMIVVMLSLIMGGCGTEAEGSGTSTSVTENTVAAETTQAVETTQVAETTASQPAATEDAESLMVYCGAGMRMPMDEIGQAFEEKHGVAIQYNYTGSGAQLSQMELTEEGDAFMPGAAMYLDTAEEKGFVSYRQNVAYHIPVITVPKGNPAGIMSLQDLARDGVTLVWGDPEVAAIGKTGIGILQKTGLYEEVWKNVVATFPTMSEVMTQISLRQADAAINWWDTVKSDESIEVIQIPRAQNDIKLIPVGALTFSEYPGTARQFVDFCVSEQGKAIFEKHGFVTYPNVEYED